MGTEVNRETGGEVEAGAKPWQVNPLLLLQVKACPLLYVARDEDTEVEVESEQSLVLEEAEEAA